MTCLALTADQMIKRKEALQDFRSVEVHNLGKLLPPSDLWVAIIPRVHEIDYDLSSTMFLFPSPQYLAHTSIIPDAILQYHARQTLWLIVIHEAHIYAIRGRIPRDAI